MALPTPAGTRVSLAVAGAIGRDERHLPHRYEAAVEDVGGEQSFKPIVTVIGCSCELG
jgi:hypothetical protein